MKKLGLLPKIIIAIILGIIIGNFAPEWFVRLGATFNGIFGNFLSFVIPCIIIGFIVPGIAHLGKGAGKLLGLSAGLAYLSAVIAGLLAYFVGIGLVPALTGGYSMEAQDSPEEFLQPGFLKLVCHH